jgi:ABC-type transporter Mla MlaB component
MSGHAVYDDGVLRITYGGNPPLLALAGEIDESTYPGLLGALKTAVDGQSEIHVSMAGVEYCDLAGLRAIVRLTVACGQDHANGPGRRRVVLHELPSQLRTVLRIVGWDAVPGLALAGQDPGRAAQPAGLPETVMQPRGSG